jgi:hypothetical protein
VSTWYTNSENSLQHKFGVELKDGTKQTRLSTLVEYGSSDPNGYSAMAKLGKAFHTELLGITKSNLMQSVFPVLLLSSRS